MLWLGGTDAPHFLEGQDSLWDSEEQYRGWTAQVPWDWVVKSSSSVLLAVPEAVLSENETRSRSTGQLNLCASPRCPRGSLIMRSITCGGLSLQRVQGLQDGRGQYLGASGHWPSKQPMASSQRPPCPSEPVPPAGDGQASPLGSPIKTGPLLQNR